jgi:hypothetical protein
MFRERLLSLVILVTVCLPATALTQDTTNPKPVDEASTATTAASVCEQPPAGFNPLTASDLDLEQYGFPPRPDSHKVRPYERWKKMAIATRIRPELKPTTRYSGPPKRWNVVRSGGSLLTIDSDNWSGFAFTVDTGTFAANNSEVDAQWIVPAVQQAPGICTSTPDYSVQWVGFDGAIDSGSSDVLQAGTEAYVLCTNGDMQATYSAWFEWFPASLTELAGFTVGPGDGVQISVYYTTASPQGHAYFLNESTNLTACMNFSKPRNPRYGGNSVEWIMERPTVDGAISNLPNFGYFGLNDGLATNGTGVSYTPGATIAGATSEEITMTCPPWNPSTACGRRGSNISTFNLNTGAEGDNTLWFTADVPAGP